MEFETIIFAVENRVANITFNRPHVLNAVNLQMMEEARVAVRQVALRSDIRVATITGSGKAFMAGADLKEMRDLSLASFRTQIKANQDLAWEMFQCPKPLIAAVNGWALGGGLEIAAACDIVLAASDAVFGMPESSVGMLQTTGSTFLLPRLIGLARAKELALTGRFVSAAEALQMGLVARVVENSELISAAQDTARLLLKRSPVSLRWVKRAFNQGAVADFASAIALETEGVLACFASADRLEGARAFVEKRDPSFAEE